MMVPFAISAPSVMRSSVQMAGSTREPSGMRATRLNRKIAASSERKNSRAPAKKKLPACAAAGVTDARNLQHRSRLVEGGRPASMHPWTGRGARQGGTLRFQCLQSLTYRAIPEVEALRGVALDLVVEVYKEGADGVLVGLADAVP